MKNYIIEVNDVKCRVFTDVSGVINIKTMLEDLGYTNIRYYEAA